MTLLLSPAVLEIEQQVRAFIDDKSAPTLEFPASFTSYEVGACHSSMFLAMMLTNMCDVCFVSTCLPLAFASDCL